MHYTSKKSKTYDIMKVITILLVVIAHTTRMYTKDGAIHPVNNSTILVLLTTYIYKFHMPLFIFISGSVYGYCISLGKYKNNILFIKNKLKRLIIPYIFFGSFYVAPIMELLKLDNHGYLNYIWDGIILSYNSRHLWYVLALFWIFIISMILKSLLNKHNIILIGISFILYILSNRFPFIFQISSAMHYQLYFFIGILFNEYYDKIVSFISKINYSLILLPVILLGIFKYNPNWITNLGYEFIGIFMIISLAIFCIKKLYFIIETYFYNVIDKNMFGIYLFHPMIIYVLFYFLGIYNINPILLTLVISIVSIIVSVYATKLMRKIGLSIFIGE